MCVPNILNSALNYIDNEGATYKQYNANTIFLDLKKSLYWEWSNIYCY